MRGLGRDSTSRWLVLLGCIGFAVYTGEPTRIAAKDNPYRLPPPIIQKMLEAPQSPTVVVDPTGTWLLLVERAGLPPIADLAQPMWRVGGYRLNPHTNGRHGPRRFVGLTLVNVANAVARPLKLPSDPHVGLPRWSPDGQYFAFTLTRDEAIELWIGETETQTVRRLTPGRLNAVSGAGFQWLGGARKLLCRFIPKNREPAPNPPSLPTGPVIQVTSGKKAPVRTYQDLLKNPYDEARFEWIMRSQLAVVDAKSGTRTDVAKPAIYRSINPSPSGEYWIVTRTLRPYSYLVPAYLFAEVVEVWNRQGEVIRELARNPVQDTIPIGGVATGPRGFRWKSTSPDTLFWVEALDGGDPKREVTHRDRVLRLGHLSAPEAHEVVRTEHRFSSLDWLAGADSALLAEYDRKKRWTRTWLVDFARNPVAKRLIWDRSSQDRYRDPGRPARQTLSNGQSVVHVHENSIFLTGSGASEEGDRPFIDRMNLATLKTERLWRSGGESYESAVTLLHPAGLLWITRFETQNEPPNYRVRDLARNELRRLTAFRDPQPDLRGLHKELVTYTREDGVKLSATLYLPPNYRGDERLPLLVWAYPREFTDPRVASQVRGSSHRFTRIRGSSHLFLLTQGYAIMDGAAMPVVGDPETANDTFVEQLVANAQAAIDYAAERGVADPTRVGVGGHSYGAFMTANLLAHSDLFRAGVARSGAYNRTLTPFGFQNERRTFWEAPMVYFAMSPFMHAPRINEPLLLIHGEKDNNSGTFPIQSERLFHAMKGHGRDARLVMLPHESHGYRSRESVLHVVAEMVSWFDQHVKAKPRELF